jgi:muramoyltetrapeptide carboxypeptidase
MEEIHNYQLVRNIGAKVLLAALLTSALNLQGKSPVRPAALRAGDKIAIISPASTPDTDFVTAGESVLRSWGYVPVVGRYALARHGTYAGSTRDRYDDLMWALRDPGIKAIIATRGGYGAVKELEMIPLDSLAKYPKWIIGYSDITAIHGAMVNAGVMSIHAHMCEHLRNYGGKDSCSRALKNILCGGVPQYVLPAHHYNHLGSAEGMLVGGNMCVFSGVIGTDIDFLKQNDIILFVEDVSESIESIDRMINHLKLSGVLPRLKGLIIGRFTDYKPDDDYAHMEDMLRDELKDYRFPIVFGFPVGHVDESYPMIEGARVELDVTSSGTRLTFEK